MSNATLAITFLGQIVLVLAACRVVGALARKLGQPQVVGEMITGVLLGPSVLGQWFPGWVERVFPIESLRILYPVSQLGLAAYMFVVGLEFRVDMFRGRLASAVSVSAAGMLAPFVLGCLVATRFLGEGGWFAVGIGRWEAMVFLGASLCITAFPMLARIIHHQGLTGTTMGTVALGAGALDDAAAWCLLAVVLASFDGDATRAWGTLAGGGLYAGVVLGVLRPLLARRERKEGTSPGPLSESGFAGCLILMVGGAWVTDVLGLHAVFGSFLMGTAMPRGRISQALAARIEPLTVSLLLPLFFTYSGLSTRIGLLDSDGRWLGVGLVLLAAIVGKGAACWASALATGLPNREALGIGALMNARGLMELIIIQIGLQRGLITPTLFAALVLMAILTTLMASPLFRSFGGRAKT